MLAREDADTQALRELYRLACMAIGPRSVRRICAISGTICTTGRACGTSSGMTFRPDRIQPIGSDADCPRGSQISPWPRCACAGTGRSRSYEAYWELWLAPLLRHAHAPGFKELLRDIGLADYWRQSGDWGDFCKPVGDTTSSAIETESTADIFLSYSREDQATARRFAEALQREGFSVWWDQALDAGENFDKVTEQALKEAKAVVVLWSKKSVDSQWVRAEATQADRYGTLVPVTIEPCNRPIMFELTSYGGPVGLERRCDGLRAGSAFVAGLRRSVEARSASALGEPRRCTRPAERPSARSARTAILWGAAAR